MRVSLFVTCLTDTFYPRTGIAVVRLLQHLGCDVDFPENQTCCGQPMYNNGFHDDARELAKKMVRDFEHAQYVVTPSGSCAAMIHDYYGDLLKGDHAYEHGAAQLIAKTYEFSRFLTDVLEVDLRALGAKWSGKATYHYSCHLRGMGVKSPMLEVANSALSTPPAREQSAGMSVEDDPAVRLLRQIEGLEYAQLPKADQCCGFGGTFATKMPEMSGAMVRDKVASIASTGAETCISSEGGCTMNIAGCANRQGVNVQFKSLAEIIAESLGLMDDL